MTKEMEAWLGKVTDQLKEEIERRWPLSDADWEKLTVTLAEIVGKAGGSIEVRDRLFDFVAVYNRKDKERMRSGC